MNPCSWASFATSFLGQFRHIDREQFRTATAPITAYVRENFLEDYSVPASTPFQPLPRRSGTFKPHAIVPPKLPPGSNLNKQLPRPRQILNMVTMGVDESETILIALGDMAFDSPFIFGEPARSLGISCNTCHNKGVTNPNVFIPALSARPGGLDVSSSYFAPHANNGHFDALDTPDLRGIRFLAPYGRNGRFTSLREFTRNVIVNEFNGAEPDPMLMDGMIAYLNEFDFLPNPMVNPDGTLADGASAAEKRGEKLFNTPYAKMNGMSCATCHDPSNNFIDGRRHDIGSVAPSEPHSRDRTLDTPTLLGIVYSAPYFHDGRLPTLRAVSEWFNNVYNLGLSGAELGELTAYLEAVGGGTDGMEDTLYTLEAELEEFKFFLSTYEHLRKKNKTGLIATMLQSIRVEVDAHKWDVQDKEQLPVLDELSAHMAAAYDAVVSGELTKADASVAAYRKLYEQHQDVLK